MFLVEWPGGSWEATARIAIGILAVYLLVIWAALVFWTYRDIRQRSRDPIVQTVAILVVLFFFLPGHWVYLVLRPRYTLTELYERSLEEEALLQELEDQKGCPVCKRRVQDTYLVCPSCKTQLKEPCRNCSQPLSYAWVICPFCGTEKPPRAPMAPPRHQSQQVERPSGFIQRAQPRPAATITRTATPPPSRATVSAPPPPPPARAAVSPPPAPPSSRSTTPPVSDPPREVRDGQEPEERTIGANTSSTINAAEDAPRPGDTRARRDPFASSSPPPRKDNAKGNGSKSANRSDEPIADAAD